MSRIVVVLGGLCLIGCSSPHATSRYAISAENVTYLRAFRGQTTVAVGEFIATEPGRSEITCRAAGPIKTPDGEPFEQFIRKAFIDDMTIAEIYSPTAPVILKGRLDSIDFSSGWTDPGWSIALTILSSNGKSISVQEVYLFKSGFDAMTACRETATALMPAVQNVVNKVIRHPDFPTLIR
jgi:hypothetical protein